jgi:hypothetical protein
MATHRILFLVLSASLCQARLDPEWKLGTVADGSLLRPPSALETPVYAPSGIPVADVPGIQLMAIQSSQLAIVGDKIAYIIDKPGAPHPRLFREQTGCALTPRREVMFYQENKHLHVLDDNGEACDLAIVGQEALHPER